MEYIEVEKARVHNLRNVNVKIPKRTLTVITGPSGSGKSSLAFDTIYAEGQRRYIESLSSYARQFLGQMDPPDVENIKGLSPAIAIDQKSTSKNPRSTVGTITEIYDYMRVLFARIGTPHCPETGEELKGQSAQQMVQLLLKEKKGTKVQILAPIVKAQKGEHKEQLSKLLALGYSRIRFNGKVIPLEADLKLNKNIRSTIEVIVDRLKLKPDSESRITDSVEQALKLSDGVLLALIGDGEKEQFFSERLFGHKTGRSYPDLEPRLFSFNSPLGACPTCNGLGVSKGFNLKQMVADDDLSIEEGAIPVLNRRGSFLLHMIRSVAKAEKVNINQPLKKLPKSFKTILFEGSERVYNYKFVSENSTYQFKKHFVGIVNWLEKKYYESSSERVKNDLEKFMKIEKCPSCDGKKLNPYALAVTVKGKTIMALCELSVEDIYDFFKKLKFTGEKKIISEKLLKEIKARLGFLYDVGLGYLTLSREAMGLSGGEAQRIRLATQIGSALSGVVYVLDEPSIGLHQRDNRKLISTLESLRDIGNTVIVVEHDEETMKTADYLVDMGPGAGIHGGDVVVCGTPNAVMKNKKSVTGRFLKGELKIETPEYRRIFEDFIEIKGVTKNNLNKLDVKIPLGGMVGVIGVSGSGKSTLIHQVLVPAIKDEINAKKNTSEEFKNLKGVEQIQSIIELDQSPIGRTPKSNPATYTGVFDEIRKLFSMTNEAKVRGYAPGRFSFNVKGGRCEHCEGNGVIRVEMNFLPDVFITCDDCKGRRYNRETLTITYKNKNVADVLEMSIEEARDFFVNHKKIHKGLNILTSIGLGYMKLGQPATTLSGGEAQRMKLSRELAKNARGHCLYVLDEPTTGLHFYDIQLLLKALNDLVDKGHTVLVIEHNLDVIKSCDHLLELGPDGGKRGGKLVCEGTPEQVAKRKKSPTGKFLAEIL